MRFKIKSTKYGFSETEKIQYESLGFKFKPIYPEYNNYKDDYVIDDYVIDESQDYFINIYSLDNLLDLIKNFGRIVIDSDEIIIYDDYLE